MAVTVGFLRRSTRKRIRFRAFDVASTLLGVLAAALVLYPIIRMVFRIFVPGGRLDISSIGRTFDNPALPGVMLDTLLVVVGAGVPALVLGTLLAWLNVRTDARLGSMARLLPLAPFFLPPIGLSIGWVFLADKRAGLMNVLIRDGLKLIGIELKEGPFDIASWSGLLFVYILFLVPYTYLVVSAALGNVDSSLEEASRVNGGRILRTLFRVSLPAIAPALGGALLLTMIMAVSVYSIAATVGVSAGVDVLPVHIVRLVQTQPSQLDQAGVIGGMTLILFSAVYLLQRRIGEAGRFAVISGKSTAASLVPLGRWRWPARVLIIGYTMLASIVPICALVVVSLQPFWTAQPQVSRFSLDNFTRLFEGTTLAERSLTNSLRLGAFGATIGMVIAAALTIYARQRGGTVGAAMMTTTKLPAVLPRLVVGVGFIVAFAGPPFNLQGTTTILLLAYIMMAMPQASIAAESASAQVSNELFEASTISGARKGRTFRRVALPLMFPGLAAGWAMLFVVMFGDLTASALLAGTSNPVIGAVILGTYQTGTFPQLAALAVIFSVISSVVVGVVIAVFKPRFGAAI